MAKANRVRLEGLRHTNDDTIETTEIWTDGGAVTVFWTVTGLGSGKDFCTRDVKKTVKEETWLVEIDIGEEIINPRKGDEDCDAASVDMEESWLNDGEEVGKTIPEDLVLTTWVLLCTSIAEVEGELLATPKVPDGLLLKAIYPNSPAEDDPHCSSG